MLGKKKESKPKNSDDSDSDAETASNATTVRQSGRSRGDESAATPAAAAAPAAPEQSSGRRSGRSGGTAYTFAAASKPINLSRLAVGIRTRETHIFAVTTVIDYFIQFNYDKHTYECNIQLDSCIDTVPKHSDYRKIRDDLMRMLNSDGFELIGCGWSNNGIRANIILADGTDIAEYLIKAGYATREERRSADAGRRSGESRRVPAASE